MTAYSNSVGYRYCDCGRVASFQCDWKISVEGHVCARPICAYDVKEVAPGKHLCHQHLREYDRWRTRRRRKEQPSLFQEVA